MSTAITAFNSSRTERKCCVASANSLEPSAKGALSFSSAPARPRLLALRSIADGALDGALLLFGKGKLARGGASANFHRVKTVLSASDGALFTLRYNALWSPRSLDPSRPRKKDSDEAFERTLGVQSDGLVTLGFQRSLSAAMLPRTEDEREAHRKTAERYLEETAALFDVALQAKVELAQDNSWPSERSVSVSTATPGVLAAPVLQGAECTLRFKDSDAMALFARALAQQSPAPETIETTARGPLEPALAFLDAAKTPLVDVLFEKNVPVSEAFLEKLAAKKKLGSELGARTRADHSERKRTDRSALVVRAQRQAALPRALEEVGDSRKKNSPRFEKSQYGWCASAHDGLRPHLTCRAPARRPRRGLDSTRNIRAARNSLFDWLDRICEFREGSAFDLERNQPPTPSSLELRHEEVSSMAAFHSGFQQKNPRFSTRFRCTARGIPPTALERSVLLVAAPRRALSTRTRSRRVDDRSPSRSTTRPAWADRFRARSEPMRSLGASASAVGSTALSAAKSTACFQCCGVGNARVGWSHGLGVVRQREGNGCEGTTTRGASHETHEHHRSPTKQEETPARRSAPTARQCSSSRARKSSLRRTAPVGARDSSEASR